MNDYRLKLSIILLLAAGSLRLMAQGVEQQEMPGLQELMSCDDTLPNQEADSASWRPSFGLDYSGEVQTDLKRVRVVNLLELHADVPLSRKLSFQLASLSTYSSDHRAGLLQSGCRRYSVCTHGGRVHMAIQRVPFTLRRHPTHG